MERERGEGRRQQGARGAGLLSGSAEEDVTAHSLDTTGVGETAAE